VSKKLSTKDTPSDELWTWFQDKLSQQCFGVKHEQLSEREKRSVFTQFIRNLKQKNKPQEQ